MKTRVLTLVASLCLGILPGATAQQTLPSVPQTLSLDDAIDLAQQYNPVYRQTLNDRGPAAWGVRNAYASFLPNFNASSQVQYTGSGSQTFLAERFETSPTVGSSYSLNLNLQLNGNVLMQPALQRAAADATEASIDAARMSTRNNVVQQYLAVLEAQAQVDLTERQVERNQENLRLAQARFQVGQTTMLDVRQAEVAKGQSDVGLLQASHLVTVEKLRLFQLLGIPAPDDPSLVTMSDTFPVIQPDWELGTLLNEADVENPDVAALRAQEASARWNERSVKSRWLPSFNLSAGWVGFTQQFTNTDLIVSREQESAAQQVNSCQVSNQIRLSAGLSPNDCGALAFSPEDREQILAENSVFPFNFTRQPFRASISVSLPIFDQFSRNLQVSQASAQADDLRETRRARELQVRTDVSQMHYGLIAAYQAIQIQQSNRVAANEQLRLAREQYRVGSGTFFNLLDAQVVMEQAEADYITALYSYHRALANLEAAVGRPLR
jgi:outer membrane protein